MAALRKPTMSVAEGRASRDLEVPARKLLEAAWKLPTWTPSPPLASTEEIRAAALRLALRSVDAEYFDAQKVWTGPMCESF